MKFNRSDVGKNNFWAMSIEGGFYFTGHTFFDVYSVIPVFVYALTQNVSLAGLAVTLKLAFFVLPQLLMGHFTPRIKRIPLFVALVCFFCRVSFFMVPFALITSSDPYVKVWVLYAAIILGALSDGVTHVPWLDLSGRTLSGSLRGRMYGNQQFFGGLGGIAAGITLKLVLANDNNNISQSYTLVFLLGAAALTTAGLLLFLLKDKPRMPIQQKKQSLSIYFKGLYKNILGSQKFRRFLLTQCLFLFGGLSAPLYIIFAKKQFALENNTITTLVFVQIIGGLLGGILWGTMSHKIGNRAAIQACVMVNILVAVLAIVLVFYSGALVMPILIAILLGAGTLLGGWIGFTNYLLEIVPEEHRPSYIAITRTLQFPFTLTSFVGGVLAEQIGFLGVFVMVVAFMILTLMTSFRLEKEV